MFPEGFTRRVAAGILALVVAVIVAMPMARADVAPTYADILADPGNLSLNLRYADAQIAAGDLEGASATLERVLLIEPRLDRVRLLRVRILSQLGDISQAASELVLLRSRPLSASDRALAQRLEASLASRQGGVEARGYVQLGIVGDTNSGFVPSSSTLVFFDTPSINTLDQEADVGAFLQGGATVALPLGMGSGDHRFIVSGHAQGRLQAEGVNRGAVYLAAGPRLDLDSVIVDLRILGGFDAAGSENRRYTYGGLVGAETRLTRAFSLFASVRSVMEQVSAPDFGGQPVDRDGLFTTARAGVSWRPSAASRLVFSGIVSDKQADDAFEAYRGFGAEIETSYALPRGQRVEAAVRVERVRYDGPNPAILSTVTRADTRLSVRGAYTVPVATLTEAVGLEPVGAGYELQFFAGHTRWSSNIANFDANNTYGGVAILRRFGTWRRD
ncbi:MAG: tetratricopeptide repeat protein [Hyphomicrobiaceae bacterium]|nr:tetratricopeptide repeat protein [Hyphomicrobiaceae bacterium]